MALTGKSNEEKIWNFLFAKINNAYGVAGLMGNLYAESGLRPNNLQNSYEKSLGMTDVQYTAAVDNGSYTNFIEDKAGYGLAQWTYWSRKQNMYDYIKSAKASIGDLEAQLNFLWKELSESYLGVLADLKRAKTVLEASNSVLLKFEKPADQSINVQNKRASYGQTYYDKYAKTTSEDTSNQNNGGTKMSNSSLVTCTIMSPNHSGTRTHKIDRITPHCVVGQLSASAIGKCFANTSRKASCNYGIGTEGGVCLIVDEANRSWCSSSNANDQRAVTIECASDKISPYAFNNTVYNKLIDLCTDICKRNGKNTLIWIADKNKSLAYEPKSNEMILTVHRWFANKSCPGDWMYARMGDLASKVTAKLSGGTVNVTPDQPTNPSSKPINTSFPTTPFTVKVIVPNLNYRSEPSMNGKINGQIGKGTFTIVEVKNGWGKLKSGAGWIYLENASYVTIDKTLGGTVSAPAVSSSYIVKVTTNTLNIRKGPGTNYAIVGCITNKSSYTIVEEKNGFGRLKSGAGWISLKYTKKI